MDARKTRITRRVGTLVADKWTITGIAGIGGMAAVYRATHRNGHEVAIKVLHPELLQHENLVERFRREGYVANKLKHSAVLPIVDDGTLSDGSPFLVMEFLEGVALDTHVLSGSKKDAKRLPALSQLEGAYVFRILAEVLVAAEASGLIHRDIKPANLFRCRDGSVRLLDFGIAMLEQEPIERGTATGVAVGTPSYMAPEQARARKELIGPHSDRFSVAASVLTLMVGKKIRHADTHAEEFALAMLQPFPPAASLGLDLRPSFAAVLDRALRFEIAERHLSAAEMLEDFERAFAGTTIGPVRVSALGETDRGARPRSPSVADADSASDSFALSEPHRVSASETGDSSRSEPDSSSSAIRGSMGLLKAADVAALASPLSEPLTVRPPRPGDTGSSRHDLSDPDRRSDVPVVDRTGEQATGSDEVFPRRGVPAWQLLVGVACVVVAAGLGLRAVTRSTASLTPAPSATPSVTPSVMAPITVSFSTSGSSAAVSAVAAPETAPSASAVPAGHPTAPANAGARPPGTAGGGEETARTTSAATATGTSKATSKPGASPKPSKNKQLLDNFR
jgi:serine/threonine protein kinase